MAKMKWEKSQTEPFWSQIQVSSPYVIKQEGSGHHKQARTRNSLIKKSSLTEIWAKQ